MKQPSSERRMQLALGRLLTDVHFKKCWTDQSFAISAAKVGGVARTEALRFRAALIDMNFIIFDKQRDAFMPNFQVVIWSNEDAKLGLIKDLMDLYPIRTRKGRIKGTHNKEKRVENTGNNAVKQQTTVNPLSQFNASDLVAELRSRGYEVKATKTITTVEEL